MVILIGLRALHTCGWVHRDISTGNILITPDGPKIVDLEFAKRVDDTSEIHERRTVCVTLILQMS